MNENSKVRIFKVTIWGDSLTENIINTFVYKYEGDNPKYNPERIVNRCIKESILKLLANSNENNSFNCDNSIHWEVETFVREIQDISSE